MSTEEMKQIKLEPISEDTVQCYFFSPILKSDQELWKQFCEKINTAIESLSEGYIWHRDPFKVFIPLLDQNIEDFPVHLASSTCFGDNIEDEWFIVHIILELTKQFNNLFVKVIDNDGNFLLIEAADYLPAWANPDSTDNRVFIYKNCIHIIPPHITGVNEHLKVSDALLYIHEKHEQTQASSEIQKAITNRIGNYPNKLKENAYNAIVSLPVEIAALLKLQPNFIAPIVDTYCHHDVIDKKSCKTLDYQNIKVTVKFTKCLYAMLLHSKNIKHLMYSTEKDKSITLGKKIACGFKMIMNTSSDIFTSKEYHKFLKSLRENGYFRGNIEGSQDYKSLLENAKNFFSSVECPIISNVASNMKKITGSNEFLKTIELLQSSTCSNLVEDDEDWLNIHPEQLNNLLNSRYGKKTKFEKNDIITAQNITTELTDFLKLTSDYEGIETVKKEQSNDQVDFEPDQFVNCVEKMLKLLSSKDVEQEIDSDFSDEGMSESDDDNANDLVDQELRVKLQGRDESLKDNKTILQNIVSSMREEQASSGPSSNLITTLGLNKTDFLDSDDD